jgi:hypothetical protein
MPGSKSSEFRSWMRFVACVLACVAARPVLAEPWRFGVLGDTQWPDTVRVAVLGKTGDTLKAADGTDSTTILDGDSLSGYRNPHMVPAYFLRQIHQRFRDHGVRFVMAVGDLSDWPSLESMRARATWTQELYDAGIGFFPVRGNHDEGPVAAAEFVRVFPQTKNGTMGATPADAFLWTDSQNIHPVLTRPHRAPFAIGESFSSPSCAKGRSYAFRDQGATFVLLDQFMGTISEGVKTCPMSTQIPWMDSVLSARPVGSPAFLVVHKPVIGATHADNLFGDTPASDTTSTAKFFEVLNRNGVRLVFAGHDHQFQHSIVEEPGARGLRLQQAILPGASYKFYPPLKIDEQHNLPAFGKRREMPLAQELGSVGYTVVELDGDRVEIANWAAPSGIQMGELLQAPDLTGKWTLRRKWGWSSRGKQALLAQGDSLKVLSDSSMGTRVRVLAGIWKTSRGDFYNRPVYALAATDWRRVEGMSSAAWTLWGLEKAVGSFATPTFALAMGIDAGVSDADLRSGKIRLMRTDSLGAWKPVGAGVARIGAWKSTDAVGTYGVDVDRREAWAVVDRSGDFAVGGSGDVAIRPRSGARAMVSVSGRMVALPADWAGRAVRVEVLDPRGHVLERGTTFSGTWSLGQSLSGVVRIRCRSDDGVVLERGAVLVR